MECEYFATAMRQAQELTDTMQAWCHRIRRPGTDSVMHTDVLIGKCTAFAAQGRIAEIEERLLLPEQDGHPVH